MNRHRFDPVSFVFGLLFVVVAAVGLIDGALLVDADLRWIAPSILVLVGVVLLVLSARSERAGEDPGDEDPGEIAEPDAVAVDVDER